MEFIDFPFAPADGGDDVADLVDGALLAEEEEVFGVLQGNFPLPFLSGDSVPAGAFDGQEALSSAMRTRTVRPASWAM